MTGYQRGEGHNEPQRIQAKAPAARAGQTSDKASEGVPPRPKLLARLPNLDMTELDRVVESPVRSAKRVWPRRVATAVLLGVGCLFLIVAINPNILGHREGPGGKPPAPNADEAPVYSPSTAQTQPTTPAPNSPILPPIPVSIPALPPSIPDVPEGIMGPAAGDAKPTTPALPQTALPPVNTQGASPNTPATWVPVQGPVASYPVTPASASRPIPAPNPSYYDSRGSFSGTPNQPMNLSGPAPAMTLPAGARFDGVIEKTTERPNYDNARSSLR
jgi:hypothetical protein